MKKYKVRTTDYFIKGYKNVFLNGENIGIIKYAENFDFYLMEMAKRVISCREDDQPIDESRITIIK